MCWALRIVVEMSYPSNRPTWRRAEMQFGETSIRVEWKKRSEETQTLRAGCNKAEPKMSPRRRPLPGGEEGQNLISWRWSLPSPTDPVWWGSMHAISSNRGTDPQTQTHPHIHKQTDRTDYNTLRRSFTSAQCNNRPPFTHLEQVSKSVSVPPWSLVDVQLYKAATFDI